ncbi:MAG TPA: hypothetical protein PK466_02385 [Thermotogota bacterium]|nr:hypothetical protein [Thermotogota bacterium]HPJ89036.1 hypothetical protein [Thermotogota bacterium]HPR95150.1 hypothetical protein [Thermotogota bacterium]
MKKNIILISLLSFFLIGMIFSETLSLTIPSITTYSKYDNFFQRLLSSALAESGYQAELMIDEISRTRVELYLENGEISLFWLIESAERNEKYIPVRVGLTNGLIGKRILLIKPEEQIFYDPVQTLEDFRDLEKTAAIGAGWFDIDVWKANDLKYFEKAGDWGTVYLMLEAGRNFDYIPRGMNEIVAEAAGHPGLAIEKNLVLIYNRDYIYYISRADVEAGEQLAEKLTKIMTQAKESGLIDKMVDEFWGEDFKVLQYESRIKLILKTPE